MGKRETMPVDPRPSPAATAVRVLGSDRVVPLPARLTIGSDPDNDLVLEDRCVSAFHCVLERRGESLVVRDRRSRIGTFVNGSRVVESEVEVGARLLVGATALAVLGAPRAVAGTPELVGEDPRFVEAVATAVRAAPSRATVLILGESGTGKELVARLVHDRSPRAGQPFVAVSCAAIARELVESELFGHERGAFTGAVERRLGVFEQADGGTLFLDEIGELPREQQPALLRVLETRRLRRVGGSGEREIDVRVVAATHRDLRSESRAGSFRLDLYHRLAAVEVRIPPLRERPADVARLARHYLAEVCREYGPRSLAPETLEALCVHPWFGNVRELRNALHRAAVLSERELRLADLLPDGLVAVAEPPEPAAGAPGLPLDDMLRRAMVGALARFGSYRRAAAALGMSKSTFHDRARRYGLKTR
jgi:DNA-binding NtrC family response regulator